MQDAKIAFLFYFLLDFFPNTYATARINATKYPIIIWNTRSFNFTPPFKEVSSNIGSRSPGRGLSLIIALALVYFINPSDEYSGGVVEGQHGEICVEPYERCTVCGNMRVAREEENE